MALDIFSFLRIQTNIRPKGERDLLIEVKKKLCVIKREAGKGLSSRFGHKEKVYGNILLEERF